jgi:hypothetical protein
LRITSLLMVTLAKTPKNHRTEADVNRLANSKYNRFDLEHKPERLFYQLQVFGLR